MKSLYIISYNTVLWKVFAIDIFQRKYEQREYTIIIFSIAFLFKNNLSVVRLEIRYSHLTLPLT